MLSHLVLAVFAGLGFALASYRVRALTASGAVAGGLFAASLLALGTPVWIVPGLVFFVLSSALSALESSGKRMARSHEKKGSTRDVYQVLANGGAAWLLLIIHAVEPSTEWLAAYLGALAAAAADTWATELGLLARTRPRMITTLQAVEPGTSGAVSAAGLAASAAGALAVSLSAWPWFPDPIQGHAVWGIMACGVTASLVDSLLGATMERRVSRLDNDAVNLAATTVGAALAWTCFRLGVFGF